MEDSPSVTKDTSGVFGKMGRLLGYVMDRKALNTATRISITQQALIQKNITYNQQGPRQFNDAEQTPQRVGASNEKRDPAQGTTGHGGWVTAGAFVAAGISVGVAYATGVLPVPHYFRRNDSSEAQACADTSENTEDGAGSPDNKACEPDNKDAEDGEPENIPQDQNSDSDRSVCTKHQVYEHRLSEQMTAKGHTVTEETTRFISLVVDNRSHHHKAKDPKQASHARGQNHGSQQAECQDITRSIMDKINAGGRRRAPM